MPLIKFSAEAKATLRRVADEDPRSPGYLAIKQFLYDLRDESADDPVRGIPFIAIGGGYTYYRHVGAHPDVWAVVWKRPPDGTIFIVEVLDELL